MRCIKIVCLGARGSWGKVLLVSGEIVRGRRICGGFARHEKDCDYDRSNSVVFRVERRVTQFWKVCTDDLCWETLL